MWRWLQFSNERCLLGWFSWSRILSKRLFASMSKQKGAENNPKKHWEVAHVAISSKEVGGDAWCWCTILRTLVATSSRLCLFQFCKSRSSTSCECSWMQTDWHFPHDSHEFCSHLHQQGIGILNDIQQDFVAKFMGFNCLKCLIGLRGVWLCFVLVHVSYSSCCEQQFEGRATKGQVIMTSVMHPYTPRRLRCAGPTGIQVSFL